ncbi:MAG: HutD family protein, partial [Afipia sp.]|nr:HutD family protein [Afipia sp.]
MRTLREADYRRMPWKNGGGETIEMMASPAGASFDTFDWRVSMAYIG